MEIKREENGLYMTDREICERYENAYNKQINVQVLAELNCATVEQILRVLIRNGKNVAPVGNRNKTNRSRALEALETELEDAKNELFEAAMEYKASQIAWQVNRTAENRKAVELSNREAQQAMTSYNTVLSSVAQYVTYTEKNKRRAAHS